MGCLGTWEIQEASMADSASSSRAVMAQSAPTSLPTACSVSVARSARKLDSQPVKRQVLASAIQSACGGMKSCERFDGLWIQADAGGRLTCFAGAC